MKHYVLVHGAWEESRMWNDVAPILRQAGHTVPAVDLPGHGANKQPDSLVTTSDYKQALVDVIESFNHQVILVGHSMNGAPISNVAERIPEKIEKLIYVTAFLLKDGGTVMEAMQNDRGVAVLPEVVFSDDEAYATLPEPALRKVGFHHIEDSAVQRFLPLMTEWQITEPIMAKVALSDVNFGSVPKTNICSGIDRMITPTLQDIIIANWKVESVFDLESGHFSVFSMPKELAELMLQAASPATAKLANKVA